MARILTQLLTTVTAGAGLGLLWAGACAPRIPLPPEGPHTSADSPVIVGTMPDTVRIETLPPSPGAGAVWVDGSWKWEGRRWVWQDGSWQRAPAGAYYARPSFVRLPVPVFDRADGGSQQADGGSQPIGYGMQLIYIPGRWHLADGGTWQPDGSAAEAK